MDTYGDHPLSTEYSKYVSESDTEGEDNGGTKLGRMGVGSGAPHQSENALSIFAKMAVKWRTSRSHSNGGTLWKDIEEGPPTNDVEQQETSSNDDARGGIPRLMKGLSFKSSASRKIGHSLNESLIEQEDLGERTTSGSHQILSSVEGSEIDPGWTALHSAAESGQSVEASLLLRKGADPNARSRRGWTPLHVACMRGGWQVAKALLQAGAERDSRSEDKRTPLHFACEAGSADCVRELLYAGAAVDASDEDARTPLHFACIDGSVACITRLLRVGASKEHKDAWGRSPEAVALQMGRGEAIILLGSGGGGQGELDRGVGALSQGGGAGSGVNCNGIVEGGFLPGVQGTTGVATAVPVALDLNVVAVFRSMGAAADWAVGLRIRSGAFQVSKVAPSNRKAFEREVKFELSGAWEEDDGADDPLWMQWKREHEGSRGTSPVPSAPKGAPLQIGGLRSPSVFQRRDEEEARRHVADASAELLRAEEERNCHHHHAETLERDLAEVLAECTRLERELMSCSQLLRKEEAATEREGLAGTLDARPRAVVERGDGAASQGEEEDPPASVTDDEVEDDSLSSSSSSSSSEVLIPVTGAAVAGLEGKRDALPDPSASAFASAPLCKYSVDRPSLQPETTDGSRKGWLTPRAVDSGVGSGGRAADSTSNSMSGERGAQGNRPSTGAIERSVCEQPLQGEVDRGAECRDSKGDSGAVSAGIGDRGLGVDENGPEGPGVGVQSDPGVVGLMLVGRGDEAVVEDSDEAVLAQLVAWLVGLGIRRLVAERYSACLVEDGFDSGEALLGMTEEDLVQIGVKKGHARLIVRALDSDAV